MFSTEFDSNSRRKYVLSIFAKLKYYQTRFYIQSIQHMFFIVIVHLFLACEAFNSLHIVSRSIQRVSSSPVLAWKTESGATEELAVILLAGGKGKRMKSAMPKQFLPLLGRPVFLRSLDVFTAIKEVSSIVIVLDESFRAEYEGIVAKDPRIRWADPGTERQDSVYNALQRVPSTSTLVAVHDAARPLVTRDEVTRVINDASATGAAVLGVPMKATVKESADGQFVLRTVPRSRLWEVHTPQVIRTALLTQGFDKVKAENLEITDDVSVIEALGLPVKLTLGEYTNIKLTTPDDLSVAEQILRERGVKEETPADASFGCSSERYRENLSGTPSTPPKKSYYF